MIRSTLIVLILFAMSNLMAFDKYNKAMGFHFGTSTGSGYSYRMWGNGNGQQFVIGAYSYGSSNPKFASSIYDYNSTDTTKTITKDGKRTSLSLGYNYLWNLMRGDSHHFYLMTGGSYTYYRKKEFTQEYSRSGSYFYPIANGKSSKWIRDDRWTFGGGPGFEIVSSDRLHFSIELPITLNSEEDIVMYIPSVGVYYYFK